MRQRVLQATLITVVLVVLMLGIPLGISWLQLANQNLANQSNLILDQVRVDTETRLQEEGKEAFNKSWEELLKSIETQSGVTAG